MISLKNKSQIESAVNAILSECNNYALDAVESIAVLEITKKIIIEKIINEEKLNIWITL